MINLFLDDERVPIQCHPYMFDRIGDLNKIYLEEWIIVRNYLQFKNYISNNKMPNIISFDHDLGDNSDIELNGLSCAKWLVDYCIDNNKILPIFYVHSYNPLGILNITSYLNNYKKFVK